MNIEQIENMPFTMSHDFTTPKSWWMQSFDKNTGEYTMMCTALSGDVATFRTFVTSAMDDDGNYLGVPSLAALRKCMHLHYSPHIKGGKVVEGQNLIEVATEPVPVEVVKENFTTEEYKPEPKVLIEAPDGRVKKKRSL